MSERTRASVLWGLVAALAFLVLVQGYDAFVDLGVGIPVKLAVALAVFAAGTLVTYYLDRWLAARAAG